MPEAAWDAVGMELSSRLTGQLAERMRVAVAEVEFAVVEAVVPLVREFAGCVV